MTSPALDAAARAFALSMLKRRGWDTAGWLQRRSPHLRTTEEQLSELLVEMRSIGLDVGASVRSAEQRIGALGLDVDIPVRSMPARLRLAVGEGEGK